MLLVPVIYVRTLPHPSDGPSFDLSSLAAPPPAPVAEPSATWVPPERIVVEPEIVPYRPSVAPTTVPVGVALAAPAGPDVTPTGAAGAPPTTAVPPTTTTGPATTTAVTTTTTLPVLVTLPAALTPLLPASKATVTPVDRGPASWFHAPDGTCAHRTLPKGTVITVTRVSSGASTTCVVDDWGPADTSRVIDLSLDTFEELASPDAGVIEVTLAW